LSTTFDLFFASSFLNLNLLSQGALSLFQALANGGVSVYHHSLHYVKRFIFPAYLSAFIFFCAFPLLMAEVQFNTSTKGLSTAF
jgi:hypothetical protein